MTNKRHSQVNEGTDNVVRSEDIIHEDVPDGNDVTDASRKDKEMEDGVHVSLFVEAIEGCTCDVADSLGNNPDDGSSAHTVEQRLECRQHRQPHQAPYFSFNLITLFS